MADILNTVFAGYDKAILTVMHFLGEYLGVVLTLPMKLITLLGEKGLIFFLLALVLMCFSKTRKTGVCVFGAVCCGALITNIILKDWVARPRPFEALDLYRMWWNDIGAPAEDGFSFPSGHVTAAAAGMTALYRAEGKKYLKPGIIWVLLMAVSRNYLMAHYPSDVLFAAIFGVASGFIAWEITKLIFRFLEEHDDNRLCALALDFNVPLPDIGLRLPLSGKGKKNAPDKDGDDAAPRRDRADTGTAGRSYDGESRRERRAAARKPSGRLEKLGIRRKKGRHEL
ncbi:MAG: phosphatase PAP2 family protein [Eubacteriales bacterium]|nr:phosphatase PAP2 family protein [Eubacteriales bacterium]